MRSVLFLFLWVGSVFSLHAAEKSFEFLDGDLIFQDSQSAQCRAVQVATASPYSHVGMILFENGKPLVCEAVQPVSLTPLAAWIKRGRNSHYVVKRLRDRPKWLTPQSLPLLKEQARSMLGKNYDALFGWDETRIYCSELVWKAYDRAAGLKLCPLKRLKDFNLSDPEVQRLLHQRYGSEIPYEETVVSPVDLFDSSLLVEVARGGGPL